MKFLLDTNICIYWFNGEESIKEKILNISCNDIGISIITLAELKYGAYNSEKVEENLSRIKEFKDVINLYNLNENCITRYAKIKANLREKGKILDDFDILIASIAIEYNLILVTNNIKHFDRINNIEVENWI